MRLEHHLVGGYVRYISPHKKLLLLTLGLYRRIMTGFGTMQSYKSYLLMVLAEIL